jgi:ribosomal protein S18 acetylase RimI-like enzyme
MVNARMSVRIDPVEDDRALERFVRFYDRAHAHQAARWPAFVSFELAVLGKGSPYLEGRRVRPLVARQDGEIVARCVAVLDERYCRHWNERLGHVVLFEAMPWAGAATRGMLDAACEWLAGQGARAARAGYGVLDLPFVIDDYDSLPPSILRQNPPYYHTFLKSAGFETEKGWVDYLIEVRAETVERWRSALEAGRRAGFEIVPLRERPPAALGAELAETWNEAFGSHWGHTPTSEAEFRFLLRALESAEVLDASVFGLRGGERVGMVWTLPSSTAAARLASGRRLADSEKLNILSIGVRDPARGQGVNLAMAAHTYLELARRGARFVSYTLVLDDNWPSRRTAEKLGAEVRANYVSYRRELRQ